MTMTSAVGEVSIWDASPWTFAKRAPHCAQVVDDFPQTVTGSSSIEAEFNRLADAWHRDTAFLSSVADIVLDPSYQRIIGLGYAAVPLMLRQLRQGPDHWYWALAAITNENPAQDAPEGDIAAICQSWLDWGMRRGYFT